MTKLKISILKRIKYWLKYNTPYRDIERWIAFRTYDKYNVIKIPSLSPNYYDKDTIILHGMMDLLVEFVEVEMPAWYFYDLRQNLTLLGGIKWKIQHLFRQPRSREFGIQALRNMKENMQQSEVDRYVDDCVAIYTWWKDVRPNRKEPEELSGLNEFYKDHPRWRITKCLKDLEQLVTGIGSYHENFTEEDDKILGELCQETDRIENEQLQEDNEMLHRLIEIRIFMWT